MTVLGDQPPSNCCHFLKCLNLTRWAYVLNQKNVSIFLGVGRVNPISDIVPEFPAVLLCIPLHSGSFPDHRGAKFRGLEVFGSCAEKFVDAPQLPAIEKSEH